MPPPFPLGWTPTATFVQPEFETALRKKFSEYGNADVLLSTQAVDIAQDDAGVMLTVKDASGERSFRSRYLVGCDGANSFVRKKLDIAFDDLAFDEWWMVVDALDHHATERPQKCFQYCWPSRPGTFLPGPGALRRWEIKILPGEDPATFGQPDNVTKVLTAFTDPSKLEIWRSAVYRFHALLAQSWQDRRILLMGDAVHQTPPFLGQGLSAGVRDAVNLAWKMALVLRGDAAPSVLETYAEERKPHVSKIVTLAKEFGLIIGELDLVAAEARDRKLRAELQSGQAQTNRQKFIPDLTGGLIAKGAPAAGTLFPQPDVMTESGPARLDDTLAPEFAIAVASPDVLTALMPESLAIWNRLHGQLVVVKETESLFADWLDQNGIVAAVVRPDRTVFGGARAGDELNALIAALSAQLTSE
jgi:3-(3-hydroxy-phenyl)propionate hydroxylase